jgi:hypothetical protein
MVSDKRRLAIVTAVAVAAVALAVVQWQRSGPQLTSPVLAQGAGTTEQIPWIDLDRVKQSSEAPPLGKRNPFIFVAVPQANPNQGGGPGDPAMPPPVDTPEPEPLTPTPTAPPEPMLIKFIGLLQPEGGAKIAVLLSEQKEILHGREGDLLGGRYRIVKIGLESIDMQDVTTGQSQKIPLRGN